MVTCDRSETSTDKTMTLGVVVGERKPSVWRLNEDVKWKNDTRTQNRAVLLRVAEETGKTKTLLHPLSSVVARLRMRATTTDR